MFSFSSGSSSASGKKPVVCTYQGAFSPPTRAHQDAGRILARHLQGLFPGSDITILYMPTANVASKDSISIKKAREGSGPGPSDYLSEIERQELLQIICNELKDEFHGAVSFQASGIEFENRAKGTATIHTLRTLRERYPEHTRVLAMGEDNGNQLAWWQNLGEFPTLIDRMLFVDRVLSPELVAAAAAMNPSPFAFASTYPGAKQTTMRFSKGWAIEFNGATRDYSFAEIMTLPDSSIRDALARLAAKTDLLTPPCAKEAGVSSSGLRVALRIGNEAEARRIAGSLYDEIMREHFLTRSKGEVAGLIAAGALTRRNTRRRNTRRRNTRRSNRRRNTRQRRH